MHNELAVSVLDLVGMQPKEKAGRAIARSVDLAQRGEQLGYKRYWLAEHHSILGAGLLSYSGTHWACRGGDEVRFA
jgi:alkanesulfonate monooxygenase SsuD/methylene tetrahydromethanopterin reductase-like flavin-dependent oxidoreductase (luciferase family)